MTGKSKTEESQSPENIIVAADHGRLDLVTALLEGGADPNIVNDIGTSALHNAANNGHWHIVRLLLEKNAAPGIEDGNCATPLRLAVRAGHKQIVRLLLECDPPTSETKQKENYRFLRIAASLGHTEIVQLFLDCDTQTLSSNGDETALHLAAFKGHHDTCELLLKHDKALDRSLWTRMVGPSLEVDTKDHAGNTPFAYAVEKGHKHTVDVFLRNYTDLRGTCDRYKYPHFHTAVRRGDIDMVQIFLDHGTDVNMKGDQGRRALHVTITADNMGFVTGTIEMIRLLLAHGAAVDALDSSGFKPEFYTNNPKVRMLLRNHSATHSKSDTPPVASIASAPPPEYKA